jgi:hypothetical protein
MVASSWLFLYDLYYDAWNHEHQLQLPKIFHEEIKYEDGS